MAKRPQKPQTLSQAKTCESSIRFYRRYLESHPDAPEDVKRMFLEHQATLRRLAFLCQKKKDR